MSVIRRRSGSALVVTLVGSAVWVAACGGSDSGGGPTIPDASTTSSASSSGSTSSSASSSGSTSSSASSSGSTSSSASSGSTTSSSSSSGADSGPGDGGSADGGDACAAGGACTTTGGLNGVYDAACTCVACDATAASSAAADALCQTAYSAGTLCIGSSCVAATCRSTTGTPAPGCTNGQICNATNQCGACSTAGDCTTAYGAGFVCSATGSCVAGACSTSTECDTGATAGQLCGVSAPNQCGACSNDAQCANDAYYAGKGNTICDSSSHTCVSATCGTTNAACDGAHLCCGTSCLPGTTFTASGNNKSCCGAADCAGNVGFTACVNNQCSACAAVTNGKFYVDPANGTDSGSGGGDTDGCRFKTLTHALAAAAVAAGTKTIYLIGDDPGTGEAFPLVVPTNVTIVGYDDVAAAPKQRKVLVGAGVSGFALSSSSSGLSYLAIDGVNGANADATLRYRSAIVAGSATNPTAIAIDHVSVTNSANAGIVAGGQSATVTSGGSITIGPGVVVTNAGIPTATATGLVIGGTANVTITGGAGADQSSFSNNTQHGVSVANRAGLTVNVTPVAGNGDYSGSPVIASANQTAGLVVTQNPNGASTAGADWTAMPTCSISGFVSVNATAGNGIRIDGGSKVTLRNSVSFGNAGDGVHLATSGNAAASSADTNYIGAIDLGGGDATAGHNTLQVPYGNVGASYNKGAGICLAIAAAAINGQTLNAKGNLLVTSTDGAVDCAVTAGTVVSNGTCRSGAGAPASVGVTPAKANTNTVDFSTCK